MTLSELPRTALVLLDCQEGVATRNLSGPDARAAFVTTVRSLLASARSLDLPCVRVEVEFRPGHPEVAASNAYFSMVKGNRRLVEGSAEVEPMAELRPHLADVPRVVKHRIGAFDGTDLAQLLRGFGVNHILVAGLITRGAVLSTVCRAADLDYRVTVLADGCADPEPSVQETLLVHVLPIRARVLRGSQISADDL